MPIIPKNAENAEQLKADGEAQGLVYVETETSYVAVNI